MSIIEKILFMNALNTDAGGMSDTDASYHFQRAIVAQFDIDDLLVEVNSHGEAVLEELRIMLKSKQDDFAVVALKADMMMNVDFVEYNAENNSIT